MVHFDILLNVGHGRDSIDRLPVGARLGSGGCVFGSRRRTPVAGGVVEDWPQLVEDSVALGQAATFGQRDPCALVFSIATLDLFVGSLLDFPLEDACAGGLVEVGDFENVCCVDPVVGAAAHDMVALDVELVDGHIAVRSRVDAIVRHGRPSSEGLRERREGDEGQKLRRLVELSWLGRDQARLIAERVDCLTRRLIEHMQDCRLFGGTRTATHRW
jgi:hypothetical protein